MSAHPEAARDMSSQRDEFIRESLIPYVAKRFDTFRLRSATLLVAQYWADEADDAVHCAFIWSRLDEPNYEAAYKELDVYDPEIKDLVNLDDKTSQQDVENNGDSWSYPPWDDNHGAIPLFAQYCEEGCHQEMTISEAYSPCVLFQRLRCNECGELLALHDDSGTQKLLCKGCGGMFDAPSDRALSQQGGLIYSIIGENRRPWLEGVEPGDMDFYD